MRGILDARDRRRQSIWRHDPDGDGCWYGDYGAVIPFRGASDNDLHPASHWRDPFDGHICADAEPLPKVSPWAVHATVHLEERLG